MFKNTHDFQGSVRLGEEGLALSSVQDGTPHLNECPWPQHHLRLHQMIHRLDLQRFGIVKSVEVPPPFEKCRCHNPLTVQLRLQ